MLDFRKLFWVILAASAIGTFIGFWLYLGTIFLAIK